MNKNLKEALSPGDRNILDAASGTSWVPNDPAEVLIPYIDEEETKPEDSSIEGRRKKAKKVYDTYGEVEERCEVMKETIAKRCKNVVVDVSEHKEGAVMDAVKRVFGTDGRKITFQMYQRCIDELAKRTSASIPDPGDK